MENIINNIFKIKDSISSEIFKPIKIENDFVIFENGAQCKLDKFRLDFELVSTNNTSTINNNVDIDPNTFFDTPLAIDTDTLEKAATELNVKPTRLHESVELGNENDMNTTNSLSSRMTDNQPHQTQQHNYNEPVQSNQPNEVRLPEWDVFDRVKKDIEIEIPIVFKLKLPKPQRLEALNDMFETSFSLYLAKQYIKNNVVNNSLPIQKSIQEAIENWMEEELYGKVKKKPKTTSKSVRPLKKEAKAKPLTKSVRPLKKEPEIEIEIPINAEESANDIFRNKKTSKWDGNLKKLFLINTEEQYKAVLSAIDNLKDNDPSSKDLDRYEEMVNIYEDQIKSV